MRTFLFILFLCLGPRFACAKDYDIHLLEIDPTWVHCEIADFNDKGDILGSYFDNESNSGIFILNEQKGTKKIVAEGNHLHPISINNAGQILGSGQNGKIFIWTKTLGIRWLNIFDNQNIQGICINDLGQIIGSYLTCEDGIYENRPFLWDYGIVRDLGPGSEFSCAFEKLGYHVLSISITSINNRGELAGSFDFGKFNEKKKKYVKTGSRSFFWNGEMQGLFTKKSLHDIPE